MLFLSRLEIEQWKALKDEIEAKRLEPDRFEGYVRPNLLPAFRYFIGAFLVDKGWGELGKKWFVAGATSETGGYFSNAFMTSFLDRHAGELIMPDVAFVDPLPFVHFSTVPAIKNARERFIVNCGRSMPRFAHPVKVMDIGCGDGGLVVKLLQEMRSVAGKIDDIGEVLLIDPSPAMLRLAEENVRRAFPASSIKTANCKMEELSDKIDDKYDIALSSLAYHHMPLEKKRIHLERLKPWIDHLVLFELSANHDIPEQHSPELALSVYQAYGRPIDLVFAHDAPVEVVLACVDRFLMTEAISFLTQPRGVRTDYHMLDSQWIELLDSTLGPDFTCLCDSSCHADEYMSLFTVHYGR
jgi:SAM-dependent methyltransferase